MRAMLPDADPEFHRALAEDYKLAFQRLRGNGLVDEPLYEGIAELVEGLGAEGWLLGVATGKSNRGLTLGLENPGLSPPFATLPPAHRPPGPEERRVGKAGAVKTKSRGVPYT